MKEKHCSQGVLMESRTGGKNLAHNLKQKCFRFENKTKNKNKCDKETGQYTYASQKQFMFSVATKL